MSNLEMKYFVLKPRGVFDDPYAKASRVALKAYALAIKAENPKLAHDLYMWEIEEQGVANREHLQRKVR